MRRIGKKLVLMLLTSVLIMNVISDKVSAYQFTGLKLSDPKHVKIYIASNVSSYNILTYAKKWDTYCSEIGISTTSASSSSNIAYHAAKTTDNGTYGVTYPNGDQNVIIFYKSFFSSDTTDSQRYETIVHETGHALGLDHPSTSTDQSKAVMRAYGFNGKAYPLSDDIAGISKLY